MKVFISGPIEGQCNYFERFAKAEELLKRCGYDVVNPTEDIEKRPNQENYLEKSYELLKDCEGIYMLDGWTKSATCLNEFQYATDHKMTICFEAR